jgi:hypothetical protein
VSFEALPRLAQLNVIMDHCAKEKVLDLHVHAPSPRRPASIAYKGWQCSVNGVKISSNPGKIVQRAVFGTKLCAHLTGKDRITQLAFSEIDWDAMELATDLFPPLYRLWVSKHVSGFFGTGLMMKHWQFWEHSECPCCQHPRRVRRQARPDGQTSAIASNQDFRYGESAKPELDGKEEIVLCWLELHESSVS